LIQKCQISTKLLWYYLGPRVYRNTFRVIFQIRSNNYCFIKSTTFVLLENSRFTCHPKFYSILHTSRFRILITRVQWKYIGTVSRDLEQIASRQRRYPSRARVLLITWILIRRAHIHALSRVAACSESFPLEFPRSSRERYISLRQVRSFV